MGFKTTPGIGERMAAALAELDDAERTLTGGDVAALVRAPGPTGGRTTAIVCDAIRCDHDDPGGFPATDRALEIYRDALGLLQA